MNNFAKNRLHPSSVIVFITIPRGYIYSCLTQLSMQFILLINVEMPTIVGILTFISG